MLANTTMCLGRSHVRWSAGDPDNYAPTYVTATAFSRVCCKLHGRNACGRCALRCCRVQARMCVHVCEREILDGDDCSARHIALIAQAGGRCVPDTHLIICGASPSISDLAQKMLNIHIRTARAMRVQTKYKPCSDYSGNYMKTISHKPFRMVRNFTSSHKHTRVCTFNHYIRQNPICICYHATARCPSVHHRLYIRES